MPAHSRGKVVCPSIAASRNWCSVWASLEDWSQSKKGFL